LPAPRHGASSVRIAPLLLARRRLGAIDLLTADHRLRDAAATA
jgi:hypothetical protein